MNGLAIGRMKVSLGLLALSVLGVSGCGGGGGGGNTNAQSSMPVVVSINWSARSRDVTAPSSALSAVVSIPGSKSGGSDFSWTINRDAAPASYAKQYTSSEQIVPGSYAVSVKFYAQTNGQGAVVGIAQAQEALAPGYTLGTLITARTVASVTVSPDQVVGIGQSQDLVYTVKDGSGNMLVVTPGSAVVTQQDGKDILTVSTSGRLSGVGFGTATVVAAVDGVRSSPATVLSAPTYTLTELAPLTGDGDSYAVSINGSGQVVGSSGAAGADFGRPVLWPNGPAVDLSPRITGATGGGALAINDSGDIAGFGNIAGGQRAFVLLHGTNGAIDLGANGGAQGVNNQGQVTGWSVGTVRGSVIQTGFLWQNGVQTWLPVPANVEQFSASAINSSGDIVGTGFDPDDPGTNHLLLYHNGTTTDLSSLGGADLTANAISEAGVLGGVIFPDLNGSDGSPFLWKSGTVTKLQLLSGDNSGAVDCITATGLAMGSSLHNTGGPATSRAVIWSGTTAIDLNRLVSAPGWTLEMARASNVHGQIVGWGLIGGHHRAFLLTPR